MPESPDAAAHLYRRNFAVNVGDGAIWQFGMSTNTLRAPVIGLAPLVGGWIAGRFGSPALFGPTKIPVALAVAMLGLTVEEPRKGKPPEAGPSKKHGPAC